MPKFRLVLVTLFFVAGCVGANCPQGTVEQDGSCLPEAAAGTGGNGVGGAGGSGGVNVACPEEGMTCGSTGQGACTFGTFECDGAVAACVGAIGPQQETCDELDNDCDGETDEGIAGCCEDGMERDCGSTDVGPCMFGRQRCTDGMWQACTGGVEPATEVCDNQDNDCDGTADNGNPGGGAPCGDATGACEAGIRTCVNGSVECVGATGPTAETCNGINDDCDGDTDEGLANCCDNGDNRSCGSSTQGLCQQGTQSCSNNTWGACQGNVEPVTETCDNQDNDCDGTTDNGNPGGGAPCGTSVGACTFGTETCVGGTLQCVGGNGPTTEVCNGINDDCDDDIDEGIANCCTSGTRACGSTNTGACQRGTQMCTNNQWGACVGNIEPVSEICNNVDDDCDGTPDNGNPGGGGSCGSNTGACVAGVQTCTNGSLQCAGAVNPTTETCNNVDDDCDGTVDNGNPGGGGSCGSNTGACVAGTQMCMNGNLQCVGAVGGTTETCNNVDDDCDGTVDDGNPGGGGSCGSNTGACVAGTQTCTNGTVQCVGAVGGTTEICNGVDDDCDGQTDENGVCPTDCIGGSFGGHVYLFCDRTASAQWATAVLICGGRGMDLAIVQSQAEQAFLFQLSENASVPSGLTQVSIGAFRNVGGNWEWRRGGGEFWLGEAPGQPVSGAYSNWATSYPDTNLNVFSGTIVTMNYVDGLWRSLSPDFDYGFFCESL